MRGPAGTSLRRPGATLRAIEEGWDSLVLEVDREWIVRCPRTTEVAASVEREARFLSLVAARVDVPVPRFEIVSRDPVFVGYRRLPGAPLDRRALASPAVATALGRALAGLHALPRDEAERAALREANLASELERLAAAVLPRLDAGERRRGAALLAAVADPADRPAAVPVHFDLGPAHVARGAPRPRPGRPGVRRERPGRRPRASARARQMRIFAAICGEQPWSRSATARWRSASLRASRSATRSG